MVEVRPQPEYPLYLVFDLHYWSSTIRERFNDIIYLVILAHAFSVSVLQVSIHATLRELFVQRCKVHPNVDSSLGSQECTHEADDRLTEILTAQSSFESLGFIPQLLWFQFARSLGFRRHLFVLLLLSSLGSQLIAILVCLQRIPDYLPPDRLPLATIVYSFFGGEALFTAMAWSLVPGQSSRTGKSIKWANFFLAGFTYSLASGGAKVVASIIILFSSTTALCLGLLASLSAFWLCLLIPSPRFATQERVHLSHYTLQSPSQIHPELVPPATHETETMPLLNEGVDRETHLICRDRSQQRPKTILLLGIIDRRVMLKYARVWSSAILYFLLVLFMSEPPYINDLNFQYACSRYSSSDSSNRCVSRTNLFSAAGSFISPVMDLIIGALTTDSTMPDHMMVVVGAVIQGLAAVLKAIALRSWVFHLALVIDAFGYVYYMAAQILFHRLLTDAQAATEGMLQANRTQGHISAMCASPTSRPEPVNSIDANDAVVIDDQNPATASVQHDNDVNTVAQRRNDNSSIVQHGEGDTLGSALVYYRVALGFGAFVNNFILKYLYRQASHEKGGSVWMYGLPFFYLAAVDLGVAFLVFLFVSAGARQLNHS